MNQALPVMLDEMNGKTPSNLEKIEPEGARPYFRGKNLEFQNSVDHMLSFMLKNKILDGYESIRKFISYVHLREDLKHQMTNNSSKG